MASDQITTPTELDLSVRKRVCKACDRCRLKKSKCDGTTPCSRCKSDNAICIFGERKKMHDKVYPKGYVEMLENQQTQLVNGLQELYKMATSNQGWKGPLLNDAGLGRPLTHDILNSLGVLQRKSRSNSGTFDEDLETLQQRLISDGADMIHPRESPEPDRDRVCCPVGFDLGGQAHLYRNPLGISQLPTPPMLSPSDAHSIQECLWQPPVKAASAGAQPMHTHSSALAWGEGSMNPAILQSRTWVESPMSYDASPDMLRGEGLPSLINMDVGHQQQLALAGEMPMPEWIEEDYVSFLDTPLS